MDVERLMIPKKEYKKSRSPRVDYGPKKVISYKKVPSFLRGFLSLKRRSKRNFTRVKCFFSIPKDKEAVKAMLVS